MFLHPKEHEEVQISKEMKMNYNAPLRITI